MRKPGNLTPLSLNGFQEHNPEENNFNTRPTQFVYVGNEETQEIETTPVHPENQFDRDELRLELDNDEEIEIETEDTLLAPRSDERQDRRANFEATLAQLEETETEEGNRDGTPYTPEIIHQGVLATFIGESDEEDYYSPFANPLAERRENNNNTEIELEENETTLARQNAMYLTEKDENEDTESLAESNDTVQINDYLTPINHQDLHMLLYPGLHLDPMQLTLGGAIHFASF